ncbi:MAG: hypothetical protein ABI885_08085 [Gammaproteobacteria bacterium]
MKTRERWSRSMTRYASTSQFWLNPQQISESNADLISEVADSWIGREYKLGLRARF